MSKTLWCFVFLLVLQGRGVSQSLGQGDSTSLFFISDCQQPMLLEKLFLRPNHNLEARDCLFSDMVEQHPGDVFLLGDLTSLGSRKKTWVALDHFIGALRHSNATIYAIPGNHEYKANPGKGIRNFQERFPELSLYGYCVRKGTVAVVMLNSNFSRLPRTEMDKQLFWYRAVMDSLDGDTTIKAIVVSAHHAPYSNSRIVGPSELVEQYFVPKFEASRKARLFIAGHSHNLEYFVKAGNKHFLVIGGGGGLTQPLIPEKERKDMDLLPQEQKPLFFYIVIWCNGSRFLVKSRGLTEKLCHFTDQDIAKIAW